MKLRQKTAIITGGNAGIGRVIALWFAQEGARVSICGRRRAESGGSFKRWPSCRWMAIGKFGLFVLIGLINT
jgi:NAD(P)-dependent dehydrogenase (short-subunit alcohol dehydrogenase family)